MVYDKSSQYVDETTATTEIQPYEFLLGFC